MSRRIVSAMWLLSSEVLAHTIDSIEHLSGATNQESVASNGRLAAGFSGRGELTVLRWPNATYYEHMNYRTSTEEDARRQPYFGAQPNEGSFAGISVDGAATSWFRDAPWTVEGSYALEDAQTVVFTYRNDDIGVSVTETNVVAADVDVLLRHFEVTFDESPAEAQLIYFGNFSPTAEKMEFNFGVDQFSEDANRDGIAMCHPGGAVNVGATKDVAIVIVGSRPVDTFQCGGDSVDGEAAGDAFPDAADGALMGSFEAHKATTIALGWQLDPAGDALTVAIAIATTSDDALGQATDSVGDFEKVRSAAETADSAWLAQARLPATDDPDRLRVAKRALLAIRAGYDAESGAIVASLSSQPPYNFDWPRDGSFFNLALDVAGYPDMVAAHEQFYVAVQRQEDGDASSLADPSLAPAGSFAMNYYSDGAVGGTIPFEIDETGLALWSWVEHAKWLSDDVARLAYLESVWPAIERSANLLVSCRDEKTGLQCFANEDDQLVPTQTLHGATTVWLGLASAVRAARFLGRPQPVWEERVDELTAAIDAQFYADDGYAPAGTDYNGIYGAPAWHLFPTRFRDYSDARMATTATRVAELVRPFFERQTEGGAYHAKATLALAIYAQVVGDDALLDEVRSWIDMLVKEVASPFGHFGESYLNLGNSFENRVAIPHLWEGALVYLSLMAAYDVDAVVRPELGEEGSLAGPACGCRVGVRRPPSYGWGSLMLVGIILIRRRSRHA